MKKTLAIAALLAMGALQTFAQGTFSFSNNGISKPVYVDFVGNTVLTGTTYSFDYIYTAGSGTTTEGDLTLNGPTKVGYANGVFYGGTQTLTGIAGGTTISVEIRGWETAAGSYAAASSGATYYWGHSSIMNIPLADSTTRDRKSVV